MTGDRRRLYRHYPHGYDGQEDHEDVVWGQDLWTERMLWFAWGISAGIAIVFVMIMLTKFWGGE